MLTAENLDEGVEAGVNILLLIVLILTFPIWSVPWYFYSRHKKEKQAEREKEKQLERERVEWLANYGKNRAG